MSSLIHYHRSDSYCTKSEILLVSWIHRLCETVSFFAGRGNKTAQLVWTTYKNLLGAFHSMMMSPNDITHETFSTMERFNILYNRNNKEDIPPTKNALMLRTLSVFHDAYC